MMKPSRVRLAVAAVLFACWIGWLTYLAATTTRPIVLSRPQFLETRLCVLAELSADKQDPNLPAEKAKILQVFWPAGKKDLQETTISLTNLKVLEDRETGKEKWAPVAGWKGPGEYLLALTPEGPGYQVTPIPRSPGYGEAPGRIYPATPQTTRELQDLLKEFGRK
jgi:hypothetical protein